MSVLRRFLPVVLLGTGLLLVSGCPTPKVKPVGKVVRGGQPLTLGEKGVFVISFTPAEGDPQTAQIYNADTKPDGTFTIIGADGKGIPPGKYKAAVQAFDPYQGPSSKDVLNNKYNPQTTQLIVEIKDNSEVVLDVGK